MTIANLITLIDTKAIDIGVVLGGIIGGGLLSFYFFDKEEKSNKYCK